MTKKTIIAVIAAAVLIVAANILFYVIRDGKKSDTDKNSVSTTVTDNTQLTDGNQAPGGNETADGSTGTDAGIDITDSDKENADESVKDENSDASESDSDTDVNADNFYAVITESGSWDNGGTNTQYSITLKNNSALTVDGWTLEIEVGDSAKVDSGWGADFAIEGGILTVTPVDYTTVISAGNYVEFGVILVNSGSEMKYTLVSADTYAEGTTVAGGNSSGSQSGQNGNQQNQNGNQGSGSTAANALEVPEPTTDDWLYTDGTNIVDASGKKVWLTGVNWFGYNTGTNTFDGLWNSDLNNSIQSIADHGFNLIRVPISAELILQWKNGEAPTANFNQATNYYLVGMDSLEIWDYVVGQCRACGLKIMIDIHSAETNASGHNVNLWTTSNISTAQYQEALCWMAERYKNDDTIIAYDLKNEPHGKPYEGSAAAIWNDSTSANNWKYVAQSTALKVLAINPNVLIMVEGTEIYPTDLKTNSDYHSTDDDDYYFNWWGGNLRGVADYPINLGKYQNKLVYSPHDYGPTVYQQPWFTGTYTYDSLMEDCWEDNWFYIYEDGTAPLLIGEWGGYMTEPNITWMTYMRQLIKTYHLNHTFWCFNANSGDTGGLVLDDFTTWDTEKYNFVKEVLWQENGKFVGLDHEIPLGPSGNGITLTQAKGLK